ncbi:hypothetical protein ACKKBG_A10850 [Auxenochlorella protothecoides x Auxenochlorella symbiontica]
MAVSFASAPQPTWGFGLRAGRPFTRNFPRHCMYEPAPGRRGRPTQLCAAAADPQESEAVDLALETILEDPETARYTSWRPWMATVDDAGVLVNRQRPTLHTFEDLQAAALGPRAALESEAWSRCSTHEFRQREEARLASHERMRTNQAEEGPPAPPQDDLDEWDLRAMAECQRQRHERNQAWNAARARVGQHAGMGSRWRHDVRCGYTGDIKDPEYKTWTHRQVWDLITLDGRAADPRDVEVDVEDPLGTADMRAVGAHYVPDALEWLEEQGKLLEEDEDPAPSPEDAAESALLASHFSDFDDDYLGTVGGFDAGPTAGL